MYGKLDEIETASGQKVEGFAVLIPASAEGPKSAVLRLPKAEEMMDYLTAQKIIYRDLGRRQSESDVYPTPQADQKLFRAIRLDKGLDFDDTEAEYALGMITRQKTTACERDGENFVITLKTLFGETVHTLSNPFRKDIARYERNYCRRRMLERGAEERRFPPQVPCELYDCVKVSATGYADGCEIPPHHKRAVVVELMNALESLDPELDPNS